jgi:hypothetical protein
MAINFPSSPTTGQSYTDTTTGQTWIYNGTGWASSYNRSSVVRQQFTASAGQTTFTVSGGYAPGLLDVYQNGVKLVSGSDYSASNGTTVILTVGASAGDSVEVWGLALFAVANAPTLAQLYAETGDAGPVVNRNRVINGAMEIDQRNAGASVSLSGATVFPLDRFAAYGNSTGTISGQRSTVAPVGFANSLLYTVTTTSSSAAGNYAQITQLIEGANVLDFAFGTAGAKAVTVSFWVRSSITGTYGFVLANGSPITRTYVTSYTVNNANTWEYKTLTIPGDTTGTWPTSNAVGMRLAWDLGFGSTYNTATTNTWQAGEFQGLTGGVKISLNTGATFYLTGVQLEMGGTATAFERRNAQQELAMCQRYYFSSKTDHTYGSPGATYQSSYTVGFPVEMRAAPTMALGSPTANTNVTSASISAVDAATYKVFLQAAGAANCRYAAPFTASIEM